MDMSPPFIVTQNKRKQKSTATNHFFERKRNIGMRKPEKRYNSRTIQVSPKIELI